MINVSSPAAVEIFWFWLRPLTVTVSSPDVKLASDASIPPSPPPPPTYVICPSPKVTVSVGASATPTTSTSTLLVTVVVSPSCSVVTDTLMLKSALEFSGGVIVSPSSWSCEMLAEPSVTVISLPFASANTAPSGISVSVIDEISSTLDTSISSAIALSSLPVASVVVISAASTTPSTLTVTVSVEVAPLGSVTVYVKLVSPEKFSFGSKLNEPSAFTVTVPSAESVVRAYDRSSPSTSVAVN